MVSRFWNQYPSTISPVIMISNTMLYQEGNLITIHPPPPQPLTAEDRTPILSCFMNSTLDLMMIQSMFKKNIISFLPLKSGELIAFLSIRWLMLNVNCAVLFYGQNRLFTITIWTLIFLIFFRLYHYDCNGGTILYERLKGR